MNMYSTDRSAVYHLSCMSCVAFQVVRV